jgi:tRNA pseudouridine32 synthase/23S rRNA pseudouridine746 synthase
MRAPIIRIDVKGPQTESVCAILAARSGLSKAKIKDAMNKGAVWLTRVRGGTRRLRRATAVPSPGDRIDLYYDEAVLGLAPPEAALISDQGHYSVWNKPPGLMAQGTQYGDHCSLLRQVELFFKAAREVFLVHRLDREASGIMLIAHSRQAAAGLSGLFQKNEITKRYRAELLGRVGDPGSGRVIDRPLDGKAAVTEYRVEHYDASRNVSLVDIVIRTGRLHQIRRHFEMTGHPVMGDPRYGKGNKNTEGLKLSAVSLRFRCPFRKREVEFTVPSAEQGS